MPWMQERRASQLAVGAAHAAEAAVIEPSRAAAELQVRDTAVPTLPLDTADTAEYRFCYPPRMISRHRVLRAVRASGQLDAHLPAQPAAPTVSRCVASCVLHVCSWPLCYARVYVGGGSQSRLLDDLAWHTMDTASHERSLTIAYHRCRTMPAQLSCFTAFHVAQTHQGHTHSKAIVDTDSVQRNA